MTAQRLRDFVVVGVAAWLLIASLIARSAHAGFPVQFERDVSGVLIRRCLECHNPRTKSGGLSLHSRAAMLAGGELGEVVTPGDAQSSELVRRIHSDDDSRMPPDEKGRPRPLSKKERLILVEWIDDGAKWPADRTLSLFERTTEARGGWDWWSLQPIEQTAPPVAASDVDARNPIDNFIAARLNERGWRMAPLASRRTRLKRLYVDLTGVPPTFAETEAFLNDRRPDAWERTVDRLLASPRLGQRWARYWLDLVRYADTSGYERDQMKPFAYRYRDWVVDSFNQDLPFDRFMVQQVAGDQTPNRDRSAVIATGFLRLGTWNDEPNDPQDYKYERLEDLVHATSTAFLALTVKCARCHDHKFDPISQTDYYRMASIFAAGPIEPRKREWLGGPNAEELGESMVLGWTDLTESPPPLHRLRNGDRRQPREAVAPASLSIPLTLQRTFQPARQRWQFAQWLTDPDHPLPARVIVNRLWLHHFGQGLVRSPNNFGFAGRRPTHPLLLDWLARRLQQDNWSLKSIHRLILTSRVYQQSSIHPSAKQYETADSANRLWWRAERRRLDAESLRDTLLSVTDDLDERMRGPGFRPQLAEQATEGLSRKASAWQASPPLEQHRRSLYIYSQRSLLPPLMTAFDFSDTTLPCGQRNSTTVAPQALAMMNHRFQHERSASLARRIRATSGEVAERVRQLFRTVLARDCTPDELAMCRVYLRKQEKRFAADLTAREPNLADHQHREQVDQLVWASLCQVVLSCNELLYVD